MKTYFDHEKLDVYQETIAFCGWVGALLNEIGAKAAANGIEHEYEHEQEHE
jgi:hypothetical protein